MSKYLVLLYALLANVSLGLSDLRLSTQRVVGTPCQLPIDRANLLRNMRKGFVEQIRTLAHNLFKVVLCFTRVFPRFFKVLLSTPEFVLDALETLQCAGVRCHLVEFAVE